MSTSFDPTKKALPELLSSVGNGKVQLPDFQRSWVWSDEHIRGLLSSVSLSYPIGAVMMLEAGGEVRFKVRPLEGVRLPSTNVGGGLDTAQPDFLLLDGQQRLTSLYQALLGNEAVLTRDPRGKEIRRWYYVDMAVAMNPRLEREDAFVSLPEDRTRRDFRGQVVIDYSTPELEVAGELFPLRLLLDSSAYEDWADLYKEQSPEHKARWKSFKEAVLEPFRRYQVPVIQMGKSTPKEAVCQIFEKVNTGGVSLTVFELVTASYAADDYNLREDWYGMTGGQIGLKATLHRQRQLEGLESTEFLQAVTLLATYTRRLKALAESDRLSPDIPDRDAPPISCKRRDLLNLKLEEYRAHRDAVAQGFKSAAQFLHGQKLFVARDLPYRTQLIPLAAVLAVLGPQAESVGLQAKLARWFWCGVFGELYASATETRFAKDFPELLAWLEGGEEPTTVREASFEARRLEELRSRNSAAYKGLYALLMRDGACDFRTGKPATDIAYFDENIDIHHIFPQEWCKAQGIPVKRYDCIVNKTPLSSGTNRKIGGKAPSKYLSRLEHEDPGLEGQLERLLSTHVIHVPALRSDDFEAFFSARKVSLLERISSAMGKEVLRENPVPHQETANAQAQNEIL